MTHYYQFYQKPYSISPPGIFGYIATHMIVKIFYYHIPPWYCPIPGGDMILKYFHYHVGSCVSKNTRGGDTIRLLIKLIVMTIPVDLKICYINSDQKIIITLLIFGRVRVEG